METKLCENDEFGMGTKLKYISVILKHDQKLPDVSKVSWAVVDGISIFDIKNKKGEIVGEKMAFLVIHE